MAYGAGTDHFLVFLSPLGLLRRMVVTWMISWLSVTVRSAVTDGGGMDHFLVFCHREVWRG